MNQRTASSQSESATAVEKTIDGATLPVTAQDAQNRFVYANDSYLDLCGFEWEEIIGQPGTMMQHPALPKRVREDIASSVAAGLPWTGVVRNLRKDGGYYWARACLAPMFRHDKVTGTLVVRRTPSREQILQADAAYQRMNEGAGDVDIRRGRIVRTLWPARLWNQLVSSLNAKVGLGIFAADALLVAAAWAADAVEPGMVLPSIAALALVSVAASLWVDRTFVAPLRRLLHAANRMAGGDLSVELESQGLDEFSLMATALNQSRLTLRATVGDIRTAMTRFDAAAQTVLRGSHDLSARTESQAANLEQTAAALHVLAGTVKGNADAATQVQSIARQSLQVANEGSTQMTGLTTQMARISQSAKETEELIGAIREIARKTNILALNAAVEAARAGAQGAGFSVVAAEVRILAQTTDSLAKQISALVTTSASSIQTGSAMVDSTLHTMQDLSGRVDRVATLVTEISTASVEQAHQLSQINSAVAHLDQMTQQNAALVDSTHSAASGLRDHVVRLNSAIGLLDSS